MPYYSRKLKIPFADAVQKTIEDLTEHGFGIVTTIDLKDTLKQKLGINFRNYKILGACNPAFAYKAVTLESHAGLMLPCNIVIQEHENGEVEVSAVNPLEAIDKVNATDQLIELANDVSNHLRLAVDDLHRDKPELEDLEALPTESAAQATQGPMQG